MRLHDREMELLLTSVMISPIIFRLSRLPTKLSLPPCTRSCLPNALQRRAAFCAFKPTWAGKAQCSTLFLGVFRSVFIPTLWASERKCKCYNFRNEDSLTESKQVMCPIQLFFAACFYDPRLKHRVDDNSHGCGCQVGCNVGRVWSVVPTLPLKYHWCLFGVAPKRHFLWCVLLSCVTCPRLAVRGEWYWQNFELDLLSVLSCPVPVPVLFCALLYFTFSTLPCYVVW